MAIKELLKKATLKLGSNGAMPTSKRITIVSSDVSNLSAKPINFTAPADGYIVAASKNGTPVGNLHMYIRDSLTFSIHQNVTNTRLKGALPMKKGDTVQISSYVAAFIVDAVEFCYSVGGGISRLLQKFILGGAVCLKKTSENLLKKAQDFLSLPHWEMKLASTVNKIQSLLSHLHQMDGSSLMQKDTVLTLPSINPTIEAQKVCQKPWIWVALTTPVLKVSQFITSSLGTFSHTQWLASTRVNQLSKSVNGGVL